MKVEQIEVKEGAKGNFKVVTVVGGESGSMFSFNSLYGNLAVGDEVELVKSGNFTNVVDPNPTKKGTSNAPPPPPLGESFEERKQKSIAYFNSVNSAIGVLKVRGVPAEAEDIKKEVAYWRDWFVSEWKDQPPF